jgi:hypothetical protein
MARSGVSRIPDDVEAHGDACLDLRPRQDVNPA